MLMLLISIIMPAELDSQSNKKKAISGKPDITCYQSHLNKRFLRKKRQSTRFIIIHTSEAGLESTLRTLSQGKRVGKNRTTIGGHAHFAIGRNGKIYQIMNLDWRADHAGRSMWNGVENLSSHSLGIELVGFHDGDITDQQYQSLRKLLPYLQTKYSIADQNVLTHAQIAYGKPNDWFSRNHRGRKKCAINFDRSLAGLKSTWVYDPDVHCRRLMKDESIFIAFYKEHFRPGKDKDTIIQIELPEKPVLRKIRQNQNQPSIISKKKTAWDIAGEDYNAAATVYKLPNGQVIRGDQVKQKIGWRKIPAGTQVHLNVQNEDVLKTGPIYTITKENSAWGFAGSAYKSKFTFYFFKNGKFSSGYLLKDWDAIPAGTKMIIGYKGPFHINPAKKIYIFNLAGKQYNKRETIYYSKKTGLITGDKVSNFRTISPKTSIFVKR
jgi:hypothetical protein